MSGSVWYCLLGLVPTVLPAQAPDSTATRIRLGAFVDVYYAYDAGRPRSFARRFTTQAVRHNEFNLNLAHIEALVSGARFRGRVALQAGTSVQANYASEPAIGSVSGSTLSRHIQEARVGARLGSRLWLDAGILFSHVGSESWISGDNPTYTRSLSAEFSPYYQAGLRFSWAAGRRWSGSLNLVNGWQNISENNGAKSVGARVELALRGCTLSAYNLIGNEIPAGQPSRLRVFHGISLGCRRGEAALVATADLGFEQVYSWYGMSLIGLLGIAPRLVLSARLERYDDPHQVVVPTGLDGEFSVNGASAGLDWAPVSPILARLELRGLSSRDPIFESRNAPDQRSRRNLLTVASLSFRY